MISEMLKSLYFLLNDCWFDASLTHAHLVCLRPPQSSSYSLMPGPSPGGPEEVITVIEQTLVIQQQNLESNQLHHLSPCDSCDLHFMLFLCFYSPPTQGEINSLFISVHLRFEFYINKTDVLSQ